MKEDKHLAKVMALLALARDEHQTGVCPAPEEIAAMAEERLSWERRNRLTRHLASCQECYRVWLESAWPGGLFTQTGRRAMAWTWPNISWKSLACAGGALLAACLVVLLYRQHPGQYAPLERYATRANEHPQAATGAASRKKAIIEADGGTTGGIPSTVNDVAKFGGSVLGSGAAAPQPMPPPAASLSADAAARSVALDAASGDGSNAAEIANRLAKSAAPPVSASLLAPDRQAAGMDASLAANTEQKITASGDQADEAAGDEMDMKATDADVVVPLFKAKKSKRIVGMARVAADATDSLSLKMEKKTNDAAPWAERNDGSIRIGAVEVRRSADQLTVWYSDLKEMCRLSRFVPGQWTSLYARGVDILESLPEESQAEEIDRMWLILGQMEGLTAARRKSFCAWSDKELRRDKPRP